MCLIAAKQASVVARQSGHGTRSVAPIPLNIGAWQLKQDIIRLVAAMAHSVGLRYRHADPATLLKGVMRMEAKLLARPDARAIVELARQAAVRLDGILNPPPDRKMIGPCPACGHELWCDPIELKSGYKACDKCLGEYRIKDVQKASILRIAVGGARGTAASISRLVRPYGLDIKRNTITQWHARGKIESIGEQDGDPVFLVWDVWLAYGERRQ